MKSSPLIWRYVVNVKETVSISSIFVAFLDNMNFNVVEVYQFFHFKGQLYSCGRVSSNLTCACCGAR